MHQTLWHSRKSGFPLITRVIPIALVSLLAVYLGRSIGKSGLRMRFLLLAAAPLSILLLEQLNERARFWLLLAAILIVPVQMPRMPQLISISELILVWLAVVQLVTLQPSKQPAPRQTTGALQYIPCAVFALAGLVSAMRNGELHRWHTVALTPLLLMFVTTRMVRTKDDAMAIVRSALMAILGFLFIVWLAVSTGNVGAESYVVEGRIAAYIAVALGPIKHRIWSVTLGTLIALGVPAVTMLLFRDGESVLARFLYGLILVLSLALLVLTAARGATFAAVAGALLALILSGAWFRSRTVVGIMVGALLLTMLPWNELTGSLVPQLARLSTVRYGLSNIREFQYRMDTLRFTVENVLQSPFGYGFSYLWDRYRIDESMMYSALLNGTGLMGFVGFVLIVGQLLRHFTARIALAGPQRDLAAIGLGTLTCGLVAGIVSESVVLDPVHSFVFWTILAAAYSGTRIPQRPTPSPRPEHQRESSNGSIP